MRKTQSSRSWSSEAFRSLFAIGFAAGFSGCSPGTDAPAEPTGLAADPSALSGEFVTYVADFEDGHSERYHTLRQADGRELRLDFDSAPAAITGQHIWVRGNLVADQWLHVTQMDLGTTLAQRTGALSADDPALIAAPATDSYAIVLVDLGAGVNMTAAQAQARLTSTVATDRSFASYYNESSYGKYNVTGTVLGPYPFTLTACANMDTSAMATSIEALIKASPPATGIPNHFIYYFNQTNLCQFGGLGEEGSTVSPSKRTWMNGSLACVVLMQEPGHNLGLMHANTMKCGTASFSTTPATSCTITEYGSTLSTMGGGCRTLNGYERWYMQWSTGCNGVHVPGDGTFNLVPVETNCPGGVQILQVPFPAPLTVSDPQSTNTAVTLRNYYLELRVAAGNFDTYGSTARVTFAGPTVSVYVSDNVHIPTTTGRGAGQNSVWTELLNTTPSGTAMTGLSAAGQTFVDPAGGPTITLNAISATGATVTVKNPMGTTTAGMAGTCIDGTTIADNAPPACGMITGAGGAMGVGGGPGGAPGTGGRGVGGTTGTAGTPGGSTGATGAGGTRNPGGMGGSTVGGLDAGAPHGSGPVTGGCDCNIPSGTAPFWTTAAGAIAVGLLRRRRRQAK